MSRAQATCEKDENPVLAGVSALIDANRQPMALENKVLAKLITTWPVLSPDLRQAIQAIVRSADVMAEAPLAATE